MKSNTVNQIFISFLLMLATHLSLGQQMVFKTNASGQLQMKWYTEQLTTPSGVNIWRKRSNETQFNQINQTLLLPFTYSIPEASLLQDSLLMEMKDVLDEGDGSEKRHGLVTLNLLVHSFSSLDLAQYMGIYFIDETADAGTSYDYEVRNASGILIASAREIVPKKQNKLPLPKEIKIDRKGKDFSFDWLAESNQYFGVDIFAKTPLDADFQLINKLPIVLSEKQEGSHNYVHRIQNLEKGKYLFQLRTKGFWGEYSSFSQEYEIYVSNSPAAQALKGVKIDTLIQGKALISWEKLEDEHRTGYRVYYRKNTQEAWQKLNNSILPSTTQYINLDSLPPGDWFLSVAALNKDEAPTHSNMALLVIEDMQAPNKVTGLQASFEKRTIRLQWDANTETDWETYLIYKSYDGQDFLLVNVLGTRETEYTENVDKRVKEKVWYRVAARDSSLNVGKPSDSKMIEIPDELEPHVPIIKSVVRQKEGIEIKWLPNKDPDLKDYQITRCINGECKEIANLAKGQESFTDTYLPEQELIFSYKLSARDSSNNKSNYSLPFPLNIKPDIESKEILLVNYKISKKSIDIKWNSPSNWKEDLAVLYLYKMEENNLVKERLPITQKKVKLENKYQETYIKAYYKNGTIIESNHWKKQ